MACHVRWWMRGCSHACLAEKALRKRLTKGGPRAHGLPSRLGHFMKRPMLRPDGEDTTTTIVSLVRLRRGVAGIVICFGDL
eukprot:scaffold14307_cov32-Tisochrysis_lutea.AAC.1